MQTSSLMSSPLYAMSHRGGNYDILPSVTLHAGRPIPSTIEEHVTASPAAGSLCQQTTVEIRTEQPLQCGDMVVRTAVRSRPVTSRLPRGASVRGGRTVSMPSWRPVNVDVTSDTQHHPVLHVIPPIHDASTTTKLDLGGELGSDEFEDVHEISISTPRTPQGDVGRGGCGRGGGATSSTAISITLSGPATISDHRRRRMSFVTPDFDPPPRSPRRFDPPGVSSQQKRATSRPVHADDRHPVRSSRTTRDAAAADAAAAAAASKAEMDSARRRYFSIAEWNRQKVLHLRRASLRRACLIGIPLSWTHRPPGTAVSDRRQGSAGQAANCRRRQANKHQTTIDNERRRPEHQSSASCEIHPRSHRTQPLAPISETLTIIADNEDRATRRCRTMKSGHQHHHQQQQQQQQQQQLQNPVLRNDDSVQRPAMAHVSRCPPIALPAQKTHTTYTGHPRTSTQTPRSAHKQPELNGQTISAQAQQKPEGYDSGLDSDPAAATRTADEPHQSMPTATAAANVDLQKVKDVLEHPVSRGRTTHNSDQDEDHQRDIKATATCDDNCDVTLSSCAQQLENGSFDRENTRPTTATDLPRYDST